MEAEGLVLLLLLVFTFQGEASDKKEETYCTAQRGSIMVEENGSVTIPCNFTHPKLKSSSEEVRVSWRRGTNRCGNGEFIYNHTGGRTHQNYTGRISSVRNPSERTAAITINNLRRTDGPMFCCRIEISKESKYIEGWQNQHGTQIQFTDEFSVEQVDVVPAIVGEDITIPCLVHYKDPTTIESVTWTMGSSDLCVENNDEIYTGKEKSLAIGQWSVVNFPQDLSLRITGVRAEDNKKYCCKVKLKLMNNNVSPLRSTQVTPAAATDRTLAVVQPETALPDSDGSATLRCSFTPQSYAAFLGTDVFWRAGSPRGVYAYHPSPAMIDHRYRGRTELRGSADLYIKGVTHADNTTYYCFVMVKYCVSNKTSSIIQYGIGTKLEVKGVICKKHSGREDVRYLTSDIALKDRNPSDNEQIPRDSIPRASSSAPPMAQEESGGVLYAHLNVSSLQQTTNNGRKGSKPEDDSQVLYAAVKTTIAPQDIYSTVNK
ncbi:sialic acid-binding Ig-like lectin 12 isoform X6 [Dendropsophus ebraccatus]|uniref:sialic acid-binding Ig-like lectin 12 isoform X6 n=1 Tax=Dendropsophus ebraccatus TaxID=150705 RepID=UPI003831379F